MFCMNCGKPLPDGSKFCPHCGTPVISSEGRGSSEEGPSLDDLLKKVDEKKEEKSIQFSALPMTTMNRSVLSMTEKGESMLLTWTAAILNTMSGRWDFSVCLRL